MRSRVRTRTHGSVGRREPRLPLTRLYQPGATRRVVLIPANRTPTYCRGIFRIPVVEYWPSVPDTMIRE